MNELRWVWRDIRSVTHMYEGRELVLQYRTAEDYTDELGMTRSRAVWQDVPTVEDDP